MATADEIRQRVEQADRDRMAARQNAAAEVAEHVDKRKALREQLDEADRDLAQTVSAAEQVMTRKELGTFLDAKPGEVDEWATAGSSSRSSRRRGSGSASGKRSTRSRTSSSASETSSSTEEPAPASSTGEATAQSVKTTPPTST